MAFETMTSGWMPSELVSMLPMQSGDSAPRASAGLKEGVLKFIFRNAENGAFLRISLELEN
jgi:hypothetical protein